MRRRLVPARTVAALLAAVVLGGCIPYSVGTTAQPTPVGPPAVTAMVYPIPAIELDSSRTSGGRVLTGDVEVRNGLDSRTDVGLRLVGGFSGAVVNFKRMLTDSSGFRLSVMPGFGFVNLGNHAYVEFTIIASGGEPAVQSGERARSGFVPYAGVRGMHVWPTASNGVNDRPTLGGFIGARIGTRDFGVSPEFGVFHDHSALGVRKDDIVLVPSINMHGTELIRLLGEAMRLVGAVGGRR